MLKRKALPVGTLFMILVLALAFLGIGYGLWSKLLKIDGTINTGEVNVIFYDAFTDDDNEYDGDPCPIVSGGSCDPSGFVEEFVFRGVLQRTSIRALGGWGLSYTAVIFAVLHIIHLSVIDLVFVFVVALFFGWVVNKTGTLLGVTLAHGITNIIIYLIAPFFF